MSASYASQARESDQARSWSPSSGAGGSIGEFKIRPLAALKAIGKLIEDKEDTLQVFEIVRALTGKSIPEGYQKLIGTEAGGYQAFQQVELAAKFSDRAWLESFPAGTVGRAYRDFLALRNFTPDGLVEESRRLGENVDAPHPVAWYARRLRDVHDVWHTLTGYGTDVLGEACIAAFTHAQTGNRGLLAIAIAAAVELERHNFGRQPWAKAITEAWTIGRDAAWLPAEDYEALFYEPLADARIRLGLKPAKTYASVPPQARDGHLKLMM